MATIDIDGLSLEELDALAARVATRREAVLDERRREARARIQEIADGVGMSPAEILGLDGHRATTTTPKRTRRPAKPKYRDPDDAERTWSGRGRKPKWVEAHLTGGGSLDDLKI